MAFDRTKMQSPNNPPKAPCQSKTYHALHAQTTLLSDDPRSRVVLQIENKRQTTPSTVQHQQNDYSTRTIPQLENDSLSNHMGLQGENEERPTRSYHFQKTVSKPSPVVNQTMRARSLVAEGLPQLNDPLGPTLNSRRTLEHSSKFALPRPPFSSGCVTR